MAPNKFVTAATVVAKFLLAFLIPFRFFSSLLARAFLCLASCIARRTITWTRTHLGTLRSALRSRDSATRCPCALNKCENTACTVQRVADTVALLLRLLRERQVSYTPTLTRSTFLSFLPPFRICRPFSISY